MRIPQIFILMVLFSVLLTSCKEIHTKYDDTENQEKRTPSIEEHQNSRSTPKEDYQVPNKSSRDSISKKRKKSKDLDTLKPKMALLNN
ncbi:hypothetical protein [Maribacter luteus]|uniref:Lipoprotein n=1 Tax=Maribacter luteus TaxID=2594478 RepID=A0A6I2MIB9_9FLAO|nr:hypothetical protein [Maribacter luteus]MRX63438.1 hypothetical protein [Maribacter luteus]